MGRLIVVILVAALAWMGWWAFGSAGLERALNTWVDERRAEGWAADVGDVNVEGFPNRFDTTLSDLRLTDPETGVSWSAPFMQLLALAYKPHQVIAVLPNTHQLATPLQTITITNDQARGSIFLEPKPSLPLERSTIVIDDLSLASSLGWDLHIAQGRFATAQVPARANTHRLGAELTEMTAPEGLRRRLDPAELLPEAIDRLHLDATLAFTAPWDRAAIETARPQITEIDLADISANWGSVTFRAAGTLTVDTTGTPTGEISVKAVDWKRMLELAVAAGIVSPSVAPNLENALSLIASLKGPADTIDADLTLKNGRVLIGPIPVGKAPRIILR